MASVVAEVLGVGTAGATRRGTCGRASRARRLLLILDNCEHVIAESARLAEIADPRLPAGLDPGDQPRAARHRRRERLRRAAAARVRKRTDGLTAPEALRFPAVQMFVERARALGEGFALTDANAATVAAICRRVDGIPLAIELAVPRLRVLSEQQLASGLDERFRLLTGGSRTAVPRHQTLHALIDWSYELLSGAEQHMLRRLSVFAGSTSLASIAAVVADAGDRRADAFDLRDVAGREIARAGEPPRTTRRATSCRIDALLRARQADRRRRAAAGIAGMPRISPSASRRRAQAWETAAPERWLARYGADIDNLRAALACAFGPGGDAQIGLALVGQQPRGLVGARADARASALGRARACGRRHRDAAVVLARLLSWQAGDVKDSTIRPTSTTRCAPPRSTARSATDSSRARCCCAPAPGSSRRTRPEGERLLREALALLRPFGATKTLARSLSALASARLFAGDTPGAQSLHQQALAVTHSLGVTAAAQG